MKELDPKEWRICMEFIGFMGKRFRKGKQKYGMKYLKRDNLSELQMELIDVANYAMMEFMKIEAMKQSE